MIISAHKLSKDAQEVMGIAQAIAKEHLHDNYAAAHLLKALLHNEIGLAATLSTWQKDIHYLREWADLRIERHLKAMAPTGDIGADTMVDRILEVADMERLKLGHDLISPESILAALCKENVAFTSEQLKSLSLSEEEVLKGFMSESNASVQEVNHQETNKNGYSDAAPSDNPLDRYGVNKIAMARAGHLDPIVGRDKEIRQMIEVLGRRSKPNPIILGEPGVGKTALVDGFANLLATGQVPENLLGAELYELDAGSLIAGASYKGEIEDRLKKVINTIKGFSKGILFIDEIHMLMDPAAGFGGAANLLKPELARGNLTVIGATTLKEYREFIEGDQAFSRRFDKIIVAEPDITTAIRMVDHISSKYMDHHGLQLGDLCISECVHLAKRYIADKQLPDSAIDLLDNTMSAIKMVSNGSIEKINAFTEVLQEMDVDRPVEDFQWLFDQIKNSLSPVLIGNIVPDKNAGNRSSSSIKKYLAQTLLFLSEEASKKRDKVWPSDVAAIVANKTKIPLGKLQSNERDRLLLIEDHLRKRVVGQDGAIATISKAILESRAGLKKAGKPVGSFFFTGPTGTGKTELAKTLAEFLFNDESALIRFDMSEFKESVSAALLYGASPGYVGYKEGGLLVNKIREKPYSIVLFDEIEKAHPSVFDVFLQILDEGRLTDKQGKQGDFSNAIILFTSNLGQHHIVDYFKEELKLPTSDWIREMYMEDPTIQFRPEFLGRMDAIVPFALISEEVVTIIFKIQLKDLIDKLNNQGITLILSDEATKYLAFKGYNPSFGARPIRDVIKTQLRQPLSHMIISGELVENNEVLVNIEKEKIKFNISKNMATKADVKSTS